ncbi:hypothetical protein [Rickettsia felis]|nr:hypothetical protein [Rickettsia felis]
MLKIIFFIDKGFNLWLDFASLRRKIENFDEAISGVLLYEIATSLRSSQ